MKYGHDLEHGTVSCWVSGTNARAWQNQELSLNGVKHFPGPNLDQVVAALSNGSGDNPTIRCL
eukprot:2655586-Rhodomonas_salina.2